MKINEMHTTITETTSKMQVFEMSSKRARSEQKTKGGIRMIRRRSVIVLHNVVIRRPSFLWLSKVIRNQCELDGMPGRT